MQFTFQVRLVTQTLSSSVAGAIDVWLSISDVWSLTPPQQFCLSEFSTKFLTLCIQDSLWSDRIQDTFLYEPGSRGETFFICRGVHLQSWVGERLLADLEFKADRLCVLAFFWMSSFMDLDKDQLQRREDPLKYVLSYKFNHNHLELLFYFIRGTQGWNANPTAKQLEYIFWCLHARMYWKYMFCHLMYFLPYFCDYIGVTQTISYASSDFLTAPNT